MATRRGHDETEGIGPGAPRRGIRGCAAACLALLCFALGTGPGAEAQGSPDAPAQGASEEATARELFERARAALNTGRFAEARDLLRRSLSIRPNAGSAFNLAVALRGTGEPLAAIDVFDRLLADEYGELDANQRAQARQLKAEASAEVAVLHIRATGADRIEIRVDGERLGTVGPGERLRTRVNPGTRVVTASAPGHETEEVRVDLARGGSRRIRFELETAEDAPYGTLVVEAVHPEDVLEIVGVARGTGTLRRELEPGVYEIEVRGPAGNRSTEVELEPGQVLRLRLSGESDSLARSPWLWTGVGLVAAGLATGAVFLFREQTEDPVTDPTWGIVQTLRAR